MYSLVCRPTDQAKLSQSISPWRRFPLSTRSTNFHWARQSRTRDPWDRPSAPWPCSSLPCPGSARAPDDVAPSRGSDAPQSRDPRRHHHRSPEKIIKKLFFYSGPEPPLTR
jgi:hypothetical protein